MNVYIYFKINLLLIYVALYLQIKLQYIPNILITFKN